MASLAERWNRIRGEVTWNDLVVDVNGKILVGLGLGMLVAAAGCPPSAAGWTILFGILLSATAKAKYWKRFWE